MGEPAQQGSRASERARGEGGDSEGGHRADRAGAQPTELPKQAYFDTRQAAAHLGFTPRILTHWRGRGVGPPFAKLGPRGHVRYARVALDEWVEARTVANTSQARMNRGGSSPAR